jgi:hypothetical protein
MSSEITYERIKENLVALNMKNTLAIIDNYLDPLVCFAYARAGRLEKPSGKKLMSLMF